MNSRILPLAIATLFPVLAGCGGGGGMNDDDRHDMDGQEQRIERRTIAIDVDRLRSGFISENGFVGDENDAYAGTIPDVSGFLEQRGFMTFDLSQLPEGATLVKAELRAVQGAATGTPYQQVVRIIVDHIRDIVPGLNFQDFNSTPLKVILTPPLSESPVQEVKTLDVTDRVAEDLDAGRDESMYRLRGQAINPLTAGNNDPVDPVDLARFLTDQGESQLVLTVDVPVP